MLGISSRARLATSSSLFVSTSHTFGSRDTYELEEAAQTPWQHVDIGVLNQQWLRLSALLSASAEKSCCTRNTCLFSVGFPDGNGDYCPVDTSVMLPRRSI
ncbi:hypothetical protein BV25DRAFT_1832708 [Artomyces pyxidatus]|uniref:Uncharacterized protein n=1 Tax=Artomyces pyxidatus TaxID=48021 RepID=A0ACB8SJI8_9AGAM|nr:hypothetical protein BV25DRAFT_1832708 [Artomyces pyxidatus]